MNSSLKYDGKKFEKGSVIEVTDPLTVEQALEIDINEKPFTVVMQTPGDEIDLTRGLLYAEDVIRKNTPVEYTVTKNKFDQITHVNATIQEKNLSKGYLSSRSLLSVSSCVICGKQSLEDFPKNSGTLKADFSPLSSEFLFQLQEKMVKNQTLFSLTGGCHGVAAFDLKGNLLSLKEDIGRHNALDKVVGELIGMNTISSAQLITFSGRISYEIVSKCFRAKIPIIIAVSSPSSLAIDFAKEYGMTILGFSRKNKTTCYSNPWRIKS